jgi:hypothetical protein
MKRTIAVGLLCGALLVGCNASDNRPQAAPTTTSTTAPDPATTACREQNTDLEKRDTEDPALDELTLSKDPRIVAAAREVERILTDRDLDPDAVSADLDLEYAQARLELVRACKVAGYLP